MPCRATSNQEGFALVAVIWSLGLITLLAMALMVGARYRTQVASNYASVVAAETAAESAINLGILTALTRVSAEAAEFPFRCQMPGGERVVVSVEPETGKVDLNTASPATLKRFFAALTGEPSLGARIAGRILEQRIAKPKENKVGPETETRFASIMELDQIEGMSPRLFRAALRLVTVRSGRPKPDMDVAPPVLRKLLNVEPNPASAAPGLPAGGSITIRADVQAPDGARFIREALVSIAEAGRPFAVREWRHGDIDSTAIPLAASRNNTEARERSCVPMAGAGSS